MTSTLLDWLAVAAMMLLCLLAPGDIDTVED